VAIDDASSVGTGTIGVPLGDRRAAILSPDGRELPPGEIGELCLTGGIMMLGYWNKPEATAEAFRGGWFHTGDLARRDEQGRYYLVGRIKDMVRRGGENVAAVEVEQTISGHPGIAGVAVTGRPDPIRGEEVEAFVLPKPGVDLDPEELATFLENRIASFKRPRFVTLVRDFPLTPSERIEKHRLRAPGNPHLIRSYDLHQHRWEDRSEVPR
jgi:crotonobetaine/carnitine-CoA ligase